MHILTAWCVVGKTAPIAGALRIGSVCIFATVALPVGDDEYIHQLAEIQLDNGFYFSFAGQGRKVAFYKRAQILVADTWSVLEGEGDGCFSDISSVTIFADYRIPQVLVHLGAMKYSDALMKKLKEGM